LHAQTCPNRSSHISYHVTQRGNYRQTIFLTEKDRATYMQLVVRAACDYGLALLGWCLMTNHVHWLVTPSEPTSMAFTFRRAHSQYSMLVNGTHHRRRGHLWQGRFYSCPLNESHFCAALAYIERNPIRANLTLTPKRTRGPVPEHTRAASQHLRFCALRPGMSCIRPRLGAISYRSRPNPKNASCGTVL
jgi:REP element-mobilizing transposase RayT